MSEAKSMRAGEVTVICPECQADLPVEVNCTVLDLDETESGNVEMACMPDMSEVWAHVWSHNA